MRLDWDSYFMGIAETVSSRATCARRKVGAILVKNQAIIATGYNGSMRSRPHCTDEKVGCLMEDAHCVRTVHAECNTICHAALNGVSTKGATLYTTSSPCWICFKIVVNAGISRICFGTFYRDERIFEEAKALGIDLVDMSSKKKTDSDVDSSIIKDVKADDLYIPGFFKK